MATLSIDSKYLLIAGIGVGTVIIILVAMLLLGGENRVGSADESGGLLPPIRYDEFQQSRLIASLPGGGSNEDDNRAFVETWFGTTDCPILRARYVVQSFGNVNEVTMSGSYIKARSIHAYWHDKNENCSVEDGEILSPSFGVEDEEFWNTYDQN